MESKFTREVSILAITSFLRSDTYFPQITACFFIQVNRYVMSDFWMNLSIYISLSCFAFFAPNEPSNQTEYISELYFFKCWFLFIIYFRIAGNNMDVILLLYLLLCQKRFGILRKNYLKWSYIVEFSKERQNNMLCTKTISEKIVNK